MLNEETILRSMWDHVSTQYTSIEQVWIWQTIIMIKIQIFFKVKYENKLKIPEHNLNYYF